MVLAQPEEANMKHMMVIVTVTGVLLSSALCMAGAEDANAKKSGGKIIEKAGAPMTTVTGMVMRNTTITSTRNGETRIPFFFILTGADGTIYRLIPQGDKNATAGALAIHLGDYEGENVTAVGKVQHLVDSDGKPMSFLNLVVTKIDKSSSTSADTNATNSAGRSTNSTMPEEPTRIISVANGISLTGRVAMNTNVTTNVDGNTGILQYYILTETNGTITILNINSRHAKNTTPGGAEIKLPNYVDNDVTLVGNGWKILDKNNKKWLVINTITKIDKIPVAPLANEIH